MFHQQFMKEFFLFGGLGKFEVSSQGMWAKSLIIIMVRLEKTLLIDESSITNREKTPSKGPVYVLTLKITHNKGDMGVS